ncbi:hypothetical protein TKK_0006381 [Trichogramma kaykai]|uniref:RRM domain-containing protein n=1 Tax=Trichogramma kaykai TaxID=54128 RepID=A0ABD2XCQ3_9HYME
MEEYNRYICKDMKGLYSLIFKNTNNMKKEEMQEIFSKYGPVAEIKAAGDTRGYHFIRYQNLEEAKLAMIGMKDHSKINLLQHVKKDKNNDRNRQNNSSGNKNTKVQDQVGHKENQKFNNDSTPKVQNSVPWEDFGKDLSKDSSENKNSKPQDQIHHKKNQKLNNNSIPKVQNSVPWENFGKDLSKDSSKNKNSTAQNQIHHQGNQKLNNESTPRIQNSVSLQNEKDNELNDTTSTTSVPSLREETKKVTTRHKDKSIHEDISIVDEVPDLVASNKIMQKPIFLDAQEVIVGNIPDKHSSAYMLHLFQKWTPLAVTNISTTKNNIRFCRIYLMSEKDACEIESRFDKMELLGQRLVVLRPNQLIKESSFKFC